MKVSTTFLGLLALAAGVAAQYDHEYYGFGGYSGYSDAAVDYGHNDHHAYSYGDHPADYSYGGYGGYDSHDYAFDPYSEYAGYEPASYSYLERRTSLLKERYIESAKARRASAKQIENLIHCPPIVLEKINKWDRKYAQAMHKIWHTHVPLMETLPEGDPNIPFDGGFKPDGAVHLRDRLIEYARAHGVPADKIEAIKHKSHSEIEVLKHMDLRGRVLRESEWLSAPPSQLEFIKRIVPDSVWRELEDLKRKRQDAHEALRRGVIPSV
ncbi:hypothetical protein TWF694_000853 [Orbilia ellipsospora]|uniref:Uncharacterized protein n=1 Tax=Orbilia ellipsospora TaxID=2528407 RepID=A0AAV9XRM8_9PEZI